METNEVRIVTLILEGGHIVKLGGAADRAALLRHLRQSKSDGELLEISDGTGRQLTLRPASLIGILEGENDSVGDASTDSFPIKAYVRVPNFLSEVEHAEIIAIALARENDFKTSKVSSGRNDYRKSILLDHDRSIEVLFRSKIERDFPRISQLLGLEMKSLLRPELIECQLTAHLDGGFYHAHTDVGSPDTQQRAISYVYYFQSRPNAFFGGELKIYRPAVENGLDVSGPDYSIVAPEDNSIVFFPSHVLHEVLPTYVRSGEFKDSRFTVNGWVRKL